MKNTAIIIPSRLGAKRFPKKPLAKINNIPMIIHVLNRARESCAGDVFVATPDHEILNTVKENGGKAILTQTNHATGSDRIYEVFLKKLKNEVDLIINLQGDMPNIKPESISELENLMRSNECGIGTLASPLEENEIEDQNVVKALVDKKLEKNSFLEAKDFFREKKIYNKSDKIYHHIGIYAFTSLALTKYVKLKRSKLEIERNLEQMRALENNMLVKIGFSESTPLGVDTEKDLGKIIEKMKEAK